jgi:CPA1 family monovalent cation:H+ antiporter
MEHYSVIIFILAIMIGLSAIADKIKIPYPILLIIAGMTVGFIPSLPKPGLNPEIIFLIFLPPMLYDAAFNISFKEFRINFNTITTLSISLVFLTVVAIAVIAHYCIPGMSWPLAFVLGSILSATDAVAAMSVTKGLGLSHKTITILEGESLINDASALVAYRFSVAAVTGAAFVFWEASLSFAILLIGGLLVGVFIGQSLGLILRMVRHNNMVVTSLMLLMPFVTYLVAEELHVSGVIAVVTLGLIISRLSKTVFPEHIKQQSKTIWDMIVFLLNGLVFIIIGLEFPYVIGEMDSSEFWPYIGYSVLIWLGTLLLRTVRIFGQQRDLDKLFRKGRGRVTEHALLDFKNSIIISWSGMRGIVSLAIAIGLPATLSDGTPFPQRNAIIFISVVVVLLTLVVQGLSLPMIVKALGKNEK